jgi:anthranilate/para-aminobenzoate synthase component I
MSVLSERPNGVVEAGPLALADSVVEAWGSLFLVRWRGDHGGFEYLMTPLDDVRLMESENGSADPAGPDRATLASWLRTMAPAGDAAAVASGSGWGAGGLVFGIPGEAAGPVEGLSGGAAAQSFAQPIRTALRYSERTGSYTPEGVTEADREEAREVLRRSVPSTTDGDDGPATTGFTLPAEEYAEQLATVKGGLESGDIYQAVVSVGVWSEALAPFGEHVARVAARFADAEFGYCVRWNRADGYFGFNSLPHVLLRDEAIETRVLAGTRRRSESEEESPEAERHAAEHLMLVDVERSDFVRICEVDSVQVMRRETVYAGVSEYLATTVRGRVRAEVDWAEVVVNAFPRAVVVGAPKAAALAYLSRLEDRSRGFYGGVTGLVSADRRELLSIVNVAYAERTGDRVLARAGGGITRRSTPEAELAELTVKLEPHQ